MDLEDFCWNLMSFEDFKGFFDFSALLQRTVLKNKFRTQKSVSDDFLRYFKYLLSAGLARSTPQRKIFLGFQKIRKLVDFGNFRGFGPFLLNFDDF